jgi:hypothetical protein
LAPARRKLPMKRMMRPEALKAFSEWQAKPDKILY